MQFLKKNLAVFTIVSVTAFLAILAILTTIRIRQTKPVAPTVPQIEPEAAGEAVNPNCTLNFTVGATPSPTPTPSGSPTPTPTGSATPAPTASPTPTPVTGCYTDCSVTACESNLSCQTISGSKKCVNAACSGENDCVCNKSCWQVCGADNECPSGQSCRQIDATKRCVNPSCEREQDCDCTIPSATPKITTSQPATSAPVAANIWPTVMVILGGLLLLSLGFVL